MIVLEQLGKWPDARHFKPEIVVAVISSILCDIGYSLPFLHPGTFAWAFLCLFSVPLLNDDM